MEQLPRKAQLYILIVYAIGMAAVAAINFAPRLTFQASVWELYLYLVVALLAGSKKVTVLRGEGGSSSGSMSLAFAITYAALMRFGPTVGMLIGAISCLSGCVYPKRQHTPQVLFNLSLVVSACLISGYAYVFLNAGTLEISDFRTFLAVVISSLIYFGINTVGVAIILGLCKSESWVKVWLESFAWTGASYVAGASSVAVAVLLFGSERSTSLLFGIPIMLFAYQMFAMNANWARDKQEQVIKLERSKAKLADLYLATIKSLALAIDAKDQYTHQHILRVQRYSMAVAHQLGVTGDDLEGINTGALLHDIGKLGVPEYVLLKPGKLSSDEFDKIKKHPEIGAAILDPVPFPWPVLPVVRHHHEKFDGTGYPDGLKGEDIPFSARILAAADVYDALTSNRSYRMAMTHAEALKIISSGSGTHFDPVVVHAFLEVIDGVVEEMAREGVGPLVADRNRSQQGAQTKSEQAARDIQRASSELWALYEVAQTFTTNLGASDMVEILARKVCGILSGSACVFLLADDVGELEVRACIGPNKEFFQGARPVGPDCLTSKVLELQEPYLGEYDQGDLLLYASAVVGQWETLNSAIIVPIVHAGRRLGTINVYHTESDAFSKHDAQLMETIAERIAPAVENSLALERSRILDSTDQLTGLHMVGHLTRQVEELCKAGLRGPDAKAAYSLATNGSRSRDHRFAVIWLDINNFGAIADHFGHEKADDLLKTVSQILSDTLGPNDDLVRYGADEFIVLHRDAGMREANALVKLLMSNVGRADTGLYHPRHGKLQVSLSAGAACFPTDGNNVAALLTEADARMHAVKAESKLIAMAESPAELRQLERAA